MPTFSYKILNSYKKNLFFVFCVNEKKGLLRCFKNVVQLPLGQTITHSAEKRGVEKA